LLGAYQKESWTRSPITFETSRKNRGPEASQEEPERWADGPCTTPNTGAQLLVLFP
jgi:hypothetical protein